MMSNINLTILEEKQNPLLHRKEVLFEVTHEKAPSPKKVDVKTKLAGMFTAEPDRVQIMNMKTKTNTWKTVGTAHVYSSHENAKKIIPKYLLQRELPAEEKAKLKEAQKRKTQKQEAPKPKKKTPTKK